MKKKELVLELLNIRKAEVEEYRRNREYGEWSCGQQDADAEQDDIFDRNMKNAIAIVEDNTVIERLSRSDKYLIDSAKELITEVIEDFRLSAKSYFML